VLQPLDFFVWAIVGPSGVIIVDTGFDEAMATIPWCWRVIPRPNRAGKVGLSGSTLNPSSDALETMHCNRVRGAATLGAAARAPGKTPCPHYYCRCKRGLEEIRPIVNGPSPRRQSFIPIVKGFGKSRIKRKREAILVV
jgi:hypothetical protein